MPQKFRKPWHVASSNSFETLQRIIEGINGRVMLDREIEALFRATSDGTTLAVGRVAIQPNPALGMPSIVIEECDLALWHAVRQELGA